MTGPRRLGIVIAAAVVAAAALAGCARSWADDGVGAGPDARPDGGTASERAAATVGTLEGEVKHPAGSGLSNVTVAAWPAEVGSEPQATVTDEEGRYRFEALPPGLYRVDFFYQDESREHPDVRVVAGETSRLDQLFGDAPWLVTGERCAGTDDCPGWQVCSVSVATCDGAVVTAEACTGVCRDGWLGLAARAGGVVLASSAVDVTAALGLEAIPPGLGGRVSFAADVWTDGSWRLGGALWLRPRPMLAVSARIDGLRAGGAWHPAVAARLHLSGARERWVYGRWRRTTLLTELGLILDGDTTIFVTIGLATWLGLP